jgi:hypothetical protein
MILSIIMLLFGIIIVLDLSSPENGHTSNKVYIEYFTKMFLTSSKAGLDYKNIYFMYIQDTMYIKNTKVSPNYLLIKNHGSGVENFINMNVFKTIVLKMATHREKQIYYPTLGIGVFLVIASLWVLFDYENAFMTVISFILSAIIGFLVSAILNVFLAYTVGIRYNPRTRFLTIDYKFTKNWFSTIYKYLTAATGLLLTLIITSSTEMESTVSNLYDSLVQQGIVQASIFVALILFFIGIAVIYFAYRKLYPQQ